MVHGYKSYGDCMHRRCWRCLGYNHTTKTCTVNYELASKIQGCSQCQGCTLHDHFSQEIAQDGAYKHKKASDTASGFGPTNCNAMGSKLKEEWLLKFCWIIRRFDAYPFESSKNQELRGLNDDDYAKWMFRIELDRSIPNAVLAFSKWSERSEKQARKRSSGYHYYEENAKRQAKG